MLVAVTECENCKKLNTIKSDDGEIEVWVPLVPARANNKKGYYNEMQSSGFVVESFVEMDINKENPYSASIYVRKP